MGTMSIRSPQRATSEDLKYRSVRIFINGYYFLRRLHTGKMLQRPPDMPICKVQLGRDYLARKADLMPIRHPFSLNGRTRSSDSSVKQLG